MSKPLLVSGNHSIKAATATGKSKTGTSVWVLGTSLALVVTAVLVFFGFSSETPKKNMGNASTQGFEAPVVMGEEAIMSKKAHGTCPNAPMKPLRWDVDFSTADRICCFNRHYAEHSGYFSGISTYGKDLRSLDKIEYFDSVTGKRLFTAPIGRTMQEFIKESEAHGWPSFRDAEVDWTNVRVLPGGEAVSVDGTHLGHNLPDRKGNRYCINLVCVAGMPPPK